MRLPHAFALVPLRHDGGMNRRRLSIAVGLCLLVLVDGWSLMRMSSAEPRLQGSATCALDTLPPEVADTVRNIHRDGPFPFPRNDGVVFGNREGHLPQREKGYYHEYTVVTPGAGNRSTKRIV